MKAIHVALAAFGGAVVGAATALLLAPEKGTDARRHVREFIKEKCPFIKESQVDEVADQIEDVIENAEAKIKAAKTTKE